MGKDKPKYWYDDPEIKAWYKEKKKELAKEARKKFEKKHGKRKKD